MIPTASAERSSVEEDASYGGFSILFPRFVVRIAEAMLLTVRLLQREASEVGLRRPAEGQLLVAQGR